MSDNAAVRDYASDRVFDGKRPISADELAKLRAHYLRNHAHGGRTT
jgi:hypothetical protein